MLAAPTAVAVTKRRTFAGIQLLRGLAAALVVCDHAASGLAQSYAPEHRGFQSITSFFAGNGGVDLFFVISGFVIVWTTQDSWHERDSWRVFLERRARRIFPLYWVMITAKLALLLSLPHVFRASRPTDWNILCSYLLIPTWVPGGQVGLIIASGWTLCFEMAFYYVTTVCLALRCRPIKYVAPLLILAGVVGLVRTPQWGVRACLVDPMLLEFVAGMGIAELARAGRLHTRLSVAVPLLCTGLVAWVASGLLSDKTALANRELVWGAPAALILYATIGLEFTLDLGRLKTLLVVGDASYSIYLTHALFLQPLVLKLRRLDTPPAVQWLSLMSLVSASVAVGVFVWWALEQRLIRLTRRMMPDAASAHIRRSEVAGDVRGQSG